MAPPALAAAATTSALRRAADNPVFKALAGAAAALLFFSAFLLVASLGFLVGPGVKSGFRSGAPTGLALAEIPADHLPIFLKAQEKYGVSWAVLAAIAKVESNFGRDMGPSSAGAIGYMQFLPSTWEEYKQDGDGDGVCDPYNPWDAVFTAAYYLKKNGFDEDPEGAIFKYNHAWWYVRRVLAQAAAYSSMMLPAANGVWPLPPEHRTVTSPFGVRLHPVLGRYALHEGVDIACPEGTPVYAALGGRVSYVGWDGGFGLYVVIDHPGSVRTMYAHLSSASVQPGQEVGMGQEIGRSGNTGMSTGPHLHFQVEVNGAACDPLEWLGLGAAAK